MFGIRYVKVPPTTYILQYRSGKDRSSRRRTVVFLLCSELRSGQGSLGHCGRAVRVQ